MTITNSDHLWLEITEAQLRLSWNYAEDLTNSYNRQQVYLNHLCLTVFLLWLQTETASKYFNPPQVFPSKVTLASIWSLVNGTAIEINNKRLVLIPEENFDIEELKVPQEWIDIPSWVADYYLAVQIDTEEEWLRVWGYTTHHQLKNTGTYISRDRTYSVEAIDLQENLNIFFLLEELFPETNTQTEVTSLPSLSSTQAHNLIQRLGNTNTIFPRRSVPFATWGTLLEHGGWRQSLYRMREGLSPSSSVKEWLETGIDEFTKRLGWQNFQLQPGIAKTGAAKNNHKLAGETYVSRQLTITNQVYELKIIPENIEANIWRFELHSLELGGLIPQGFKLKLLTEELAEFENNENIATVAVQKLLLEIALESGEGLVWEIDPLPDNYDREILRF